MAGLGSRFSNEGYQLPKPLIPVSGDPMIIKVIRDLPVANKWVFIVRQEHIDDFAIDRLIEDEIPNAVVIPVEKTTEGQACTCLLAEPYLDRDQPLLISACDNGFTFDSNKFESLSADSSIDSIVWTFTGDPLLAKKPTDFGWCRLEEDGRTIADMSVKKPISDDPINDHAVIATFYFKTAELFSEAANNMIEANHRINNEFYVDAVPVFMKKMGKRSVIFDVDELLSWGTPAALYSYQLKEYYHRNAALNDKNSAVINTYFDLKAME